MSTRTNTAKWDSTRQQWRVSVQKDGVRKNFYSSKAGRAGQRIANAKADAWLDGTQTQPNARFDAVYVQFLAQKEKTVSKGYLDAMQSRYTHHIKPVLGNCKVAALNDGKLQGVIDTAYSKHGLSAKTLRNIAGDLTAFCKYCRLHQISTLRPENITIPAEAARPDKSILQPDDIAKLFAFSNTLTRGKPEPDPYVHAYRLAVLTGLRPGELIGLRWADTRADRIHVSRAINVNGAVTQGKNKNAVRTIVLSDRAKQELHEQWLLTAGQESVFGITSQSTLRHCWQRFCDYNDISYVSLYELRHTFVSVAQTLPEGMVKKLVGHSKDMDTWGTYAHMMDGQDAQQAAMLERAFDAVLNEQKA